MDYLEIIRQAEEAHQPMNSGGKSTGSLHPPSVNPGDRITWQGVDGKTRGPAIVDFLHAASDGRCWAFVTLADSWAAVNTTHVTKTEGSQTP